MKGKGSQDVLGDPAQPPCPSEVGLCKMTSWDPVIPQVLVRIHFIGACGRWGPSQSFYQHPSMQDFGLGPIPLHQGAGTQKYLPSHAKTLYEVPRTIENFFLILEVKRKRWGKGNEIKFSVTWVCKTWLFILFLLSNFLGL